MCGIVTGKWNELRPALEAATQRVFRTVLLLTGSSESVEQVVMDGIDALDSEDLLADGFLIYASTIAVKKSRANPEAQYAEWEDMPLEIQRVLQLSLALRHCFVLRILLGMSVDEVSRITQSAAETVLENTYAAVLALSVMNCSGTVCDQAANRAELQSA